MASEADHQQVFRDAVETSRLTAWLKRIWVRQHPSTFWVVVPLPFLDLACAGISMVVAYILRFHVLEYRGSLLPDAYVDFALFAVIMWVVIFAIYRLYHPDFLLGGLREYANVFNGCTTVMLALVVYSFLNRGIPQDVSRGWLAFVWLFSVSSICLIRFSYRRLVYHLRRRGLFTQRALVVGVNEEGRAVAAQLRASPSAGVQVVGFVKPASTAEAQVDGLPVMGGFSRLENMTRSLEIGALIVIPTALHREDLLSIYRDWGAEKKLRIHLSSGLYELFTTGVQVREIGRIPLMCLNRMRITGTDALMKTMLDYLGAMTCIILLAPVLPTIALLIRLDSAGPIFHRRRVVGLAGREFDAYKFRSMIRDADVYLEGHREMKDEWARIGKIQDDPRITRVGRFLRRYSLDELPQLFNVLKGQMSLVGPRMITPAELEHFSQWQHNLLTVKPGMTGLWQVNGRAELTYPERVRLDMYYIRNYTIWSDVVILLKTIGVVLQGTGAN